MENFDASGFRRVLGNFATGVAVVTTTCSDGSFRGITINSFSSVSLSPPLILFSIDKKSHSYDHFIGSDNFLINILSESQSEISSKFAKPSFVDWENIQFSSSQTSSPLLSGVIAYLDCEKETIYDGGDHKIIIGRVINLNVLSDEKPLVYYKGEYSNIK